MANFSVEWLSKSYYDRANAACESTTHRRESSPNSPNSPNNSCSYASGSESEVGDDSEGEAVQQRRMRTKFSSEQIGKLEDAFSRRRYLGAGQRRKMAEKLQLSETQVKTWFQNRRMKLKREVQDLHQDLHLRVPATLLPPLLFQHPALSGQLPGLYPLLPPLHGAPLPADALRPPRSHHPGVTPSHFY